MIKLQSADLSQYLIDRYNYQIVGLIDLDRVLQQPRKTLFDLFFQYHKPSFDPNEKIVLFSRNAVDLEVLEHIQKTASLIDISNSFILICAADIDLDHLESVKERFSTDIFAFSFIQIKFLDKIGKIEINSLISLPENFCFSPWAHLEISSQGEFKPCCMYAESIKDPTGRPYNINVEDIETVYHSQYLSSLRQQFLQGQKPAGCSHCWLKEEHQGKSNRHWIRDHLGLNAHRLEIEKDSIQNLISLDIKLGNLCNFKCRICDPVYSSRIAEEQVKHLGSMIDLKDLNKTGQWADNPKIWKMLEQIANHLTNIDFYGGEPFLVKQHEMFLDYLIEKNYASAIRLHYTSNGSIRPKHFFEKWQQFRQVDIAFSIDDIGVRFELERGGRWEDVESNLDWFLEHRLPNMVLSVFPTVNIQNVFYIDSLIDWFETKKFNALIFNLLERPDFLCVTKMNQELSEMVINRLSTIDKTRLQKYNLQSLISLIQDHTHSSNMIDKLAAYIKKLDRIRNQDFSLTHPEIAGIIFKENHRRKIV